MTLQSKIGFLILAIALMLGLSHFFIQRATIFPAIINIERSFAQKDMERCVEALNRQLQFLDRTVEDWASWDETYAFMEDIDLDYIKSNLLENAFTKNNINLIYYVDPKGWVVWGKAYTHNFSEEISLIDFPQKLPQFHPLLQHGNNQPSINGAFITENGPMLIAARPIRSSSKQNISRGTLIMGQFINHDFLDNLISQTRVILKISPFTDQEPSTQAIIAQIKRGEPYPIRILNDETLLAYTTFAGINNRPTLLLQGEIPREISMKSKASQHTSLAFMAMICITLFLVLFFILDKIAFQPLQTLVRHTSEIRRQQDLLSRLPDNDRNDEIGSLTREMNHLLDFQYESTETLENRVKNRTLELSASNNLLKSEIAKHQQTQAEFALLNDELEAIFTTSRVGIMLLRSGRVLDKCNQQLAEIYGYDSPEAMKKISMKDLHLSTEKYKEFGEKYYQTLRDGAQLHVEYEFKKKDGSRIWCLVSGMAMDTASPPDLDKGVTWVVDDITARKEAELKLAELATMQGMFATIGGVCHELGQPVQIISAHTQILKKQSKPIPPQVMNRINSIHEQTERMGDILKKLQTISRFETTDYVEGMQILDIYKSATANLAEDDPAHT